MLVGYLLSLALHAGAQGTVVFMMLSSVVAMNGSNALGDHRRRANARTAAFFPVAIGAGLTMGTLLSVNHYASLAGFIVVMFLAVWVRRFGGPFFFYGFMGWMGYFFASFLGTSFAALPGMLVAVIAASAVMLLLSITIARPDPRKTLASVFRAMSARQRGLARACIALIEADAGSPASDRASLAVFRARARLTDTALMSDGWAAHAPALPAGWTASALRSRLLNVQLGLDRLTIGARELAASVASPALRHAVVDAFRALADANLGRARDAAARLSELSDDSPRAVRAAVRNLERGFGVITAVPNRPVLSREVAKNEDSFVPAVELMLGQLPGSPSVASGIEARGGAWNPIVRLPFATRQAVQAAVAGILAIIVGSLISGQRYYWAVIAAFVAFAGTGTRFDTTRKAVLRVAGTLAGLGAGILIAHATSGHTFAALVVIVVSIFCGNYLMRVSYGYMIFFITIMLSELYSILGEFSDSLLLLRLAETAAGAAIGILVALVVSPVSTRDALDQTEGAVVEAVAKALDRVRARALNPASVSATALDGDIIAVDNQLRRLVLIGEPLTRYQAWENRPRAIRRRLTVVGNLLATLRTVDYAVRRLTVGDAELAGEVGKVADYARAVAAARGDAVVVRNPPVLAREILDTRTLDIAQGRPAEAYTAVARLQALLEDLA
ncbi:FUSC family protein [Gryllotalpicola reticulitermitis]|uniref:FUSC family protein n=1 Tax=Gryllotalpicola reticulitermitis TaxID=1184153 RepID=A0ABV8Q2Y5_9MICO